MLSPVSTDHLQTELPSEVYYALVFYDKSVNIKSHRFELKQQTKYQ